MVWRLQITFIKLEKIETIGLRVPLKKVYKGSYYSMPTRCTIITRITDSDGLVGESYNADEDKEQEDIIDIINNELFPLIKNKEYSSPSGFWEAMVPSTFDQLRDRKLATRAIASVDSALWDLYAKRLNVPVRKLWGGYRDDLPIIGIGGYYSEDISDIDKEIDYWVEKDVAGMKFKIGKLSPEEDIERLRRGVNRAPEKFKFVVDANQGYKYWDAVKFSELSKNITELEWFEEPCRWQNDIRDMSNLRLATNVKIAAGQSEISSHAISRMITTNAVDVVNFDASWGGGPTEWLKVAGMTAIHGIELGHHEEFQLASHLLASVPNGKFVEIFEEDRDPIYWNLIENRPEIKKGVINLPSDPGFGWVLNEDFISEYKV